MSDKTTRLSALPAIATPADDTSIILTDAAGSAQRVKISDLLRLVRDSIQIGGRNLVRSTIYSSGVPGAKYTNSLCLDYAGSTICRKSLTRKIETGEYYSCSFWAKADNPTRLNIDIDDHGSRMWEIDQTWRYVHDTIYIKNEAISSYSFIDFNFDKAMNKKIYISDLIVTKGNIPMLDWFPAPEDLAGNGGG